MRITRILRKFRILSRIPLVCLHPDENLVFSWWGHNAAEVADCSKCGHTIFPGELEWAERNLTKVMRERCRLEALDTHPER